MDHTGGSYMQQPFTSSEAVRRCFHVPTAPLSSQVNAKVPRPPYGQGRPTSAPVRRSSYTYGNGGTHTDAVYSRYTHDTSVSRFAPFAARKTEAFMNSSLGYPVPDGGKSYPLPNYTPLNDPHLVEYFERRFGTLQLDALRRQRNSIVRSSSSSSLGLRRSVTPQKGDIQYKVFVTTGMEKGASTDAKVYLKMTGTKGKFPKHRLTKKAGSVRSNNAVSFNFSKGTTHMFKVKGPNIGDIKSIVMEHSGTSREQSWFLEKVKILNTKNKKQWVFHCGQWLSYYHTDGKTSRQLFPQVASKTEYEIVTVTGDKRGAGTDANVFVKIFGKTGATGKFHLRSNVKSTFKRNSSNSFRVSSNCVGPLTKLRVEHDNTGLAAGWFLERVVVTDLNNPKWKYFFPCGQWLAKDEGDGSISRDLIGSRDPMAIRKMAKYKVTVFTGNVKGAGTDANVYLTMFGENGDSGERPLRKAKKNNFERGKRDEFIVECPRLGRLERLRIGHDNSGFGPGWFLDKIIIDDVEMGSVYEFPCGRWFASDEDDGQISRDLLLNVGPMEAAPDTGIPYIITVTTGDKANAGTDARVYIELFGDKGKETSGKIWLDNGKFDRNKTDIFNIGVAKMMSPLDHIIIGHDNSGAAPGWYLDSVSVYCASAGIEQFFLCGKWLASDEHEEVIQRTLYEQVSRRKKREKKMTWFVWVHTSDLQNAGTDANVYVTMYGEKGKTDDHLLENKGDTFEQGKMDRFKLDLTDIGKPYKLRVWHDNKGAFSGWHLNKVEMENMTTKDRYIFTCDKWMATDEDQGETVREMPAEGPLVKKPMSLVSYSVEVHTGKRQYAGTDANVYVNIFGDFGDTGKRNLRKSKNNINKFEKDKFSPGQVDTFEIEAVTLKKLNKIRVGHDGKGPGSGWFLDKIVVKQIGSTKYDTTFECNRWLAEDEDDGHIERDITASGSQMLGTTRYVIDVKTGDVRGAGTDANVFLKIFGSKGDTGDMQLKSSESATNKFERNRTDKFIKDASDIGKIKSVRIGHDGTKPGAGWFLDNVSIDIPSRGEHYYFAAHRWLAKDEEDGQLEIDMDPSSTEQREKTIPYEVTIWTSNKRGAGTDANVFLQMYGEKGKKTEDIQLRNKTDNFEQAEMDKFKVEAADIGRLQKVRIGHDGAGRFAGWHMEKMLIQRKPLSGTKKRRRPSDLERRRSARDEEESDSTGYSPPSTPKRRKKKAHRSSLERVDEADEDVYDGDETEDYWFFVDRWFAKGEDDNQIVRELIPTDERGNRLKGTLKELEYTVKIFTGDVFGAGTDANVFVNLYGENGDSGERHMKESSKMNKFEKNQEDVFKVKAIDLGKLTKLKIHHDNKGGGAAWFLDRVEVEEPISRKSYFFPCQRWLATNQDDGQIARDLVPVDQSLRRKLSRKDSTAIRDEIALETKAAMTTYHVKVTTGNVWGAGTDANVYVILFGEEDITGKMFLKSSLTSKNKFEKGKMDEFILECVKIGELKKIKIGHDNAGGGAAWHLDNVVIDCPSLGRMWTFPCNRWLGEKEDDGAIERELFPQELATQEYVPCIPYEITTYTSDRSGAGTDADVFVVLYGKETCTLQKPLCNTKRERKEKFNKGSADKFVIELEDVGQTIDKIRIGHDGSGFGAAWHLNKVEVRKLHTTGKGSITYEFPCDRWLARNEDDGAIVRELLPKKATKEVIGRDGEVKVVDHKLRDKLQAKKYIVNVYTGGEKGGGTDANVFLTIFGERGDTGERKLHTSETHRDKFEKNQHDKFNIEAGDLGKLHKIYIRHDNSMLSPAWYLDRVEIQDTIDNQNYIFHCERWLAKNKGDGKIERHLYVKGYDGEMSSTGTLRSTKYGSVSSLDSMRTTDPFSKSPRLNRRQSLMSSMEEVTEGPTIPYTVKVTTGNGEDNGTSSNVYVRIIGPKKVHTGRLFLELAQKENFTPGSVETFSLEAIEVDEVKKIEVGHDGNAPGTGWFLKEVEVDLPTKGKHYHFTAQCWLAKDKGDGRISRTFSVDDGQSSVTSYRPMLPYEVSIQTGDISEAGTDCKIFITVFGQKGSTSQMELPKNEDRFERDRTDLVKLELDDIAPLKKLRVSVEPKAGRQSWFMDKIELRNMETGVLSVFNYKDWLGKGKDKGEGRLSVDIPATERGKAVIGKTHYKISVNTTDIRGSGTDANVYIILFGANGDSGDIHLDKSETNKDPFEQGRNDVFTIKNILTLGELSKLRVWHDNKGLGASWHLASIDVEDLSSHKTYNFICNRWLSKSEDDKQLIRELTCSNQLQSDSGSSGKVVYDIEVTTTDKKEGGTIHNAWLILEGSRKTSKPFHIENSPQNKVLRRGQTDNFRMTSAALGKLESCIIGAYEREDRPITTSEGKEGSWHCHEVVVTDTTGGGKFYFPCKSWVPINRKFSKNSGKQLDVKKVEESQVSKTRDLAPVKYEIIVHTGNVKGSGTNANVSITIFGENGDTGKRPLKQKFRDLFEKNQTDKFEIEALDLGELKKIRIEHDNTGFRPGWFLDNVQIVNKATEVTYNYPCEKWFDKDKGDGEICREVYVRHD
ncbi:lipoxygenase homology domain-containing protein 1-like isoform X2 [Haliotis rufescens]|uniref:lipoxygenase homology domain-containing protein 1-like isoform X2 n=1 Tax=Haliotis rufescens TaxID=6454 RepID=UPI00201F3D34|nr:lipoxygenase homology domain-containing protein 1-like isoform X2 [Haliotis rufescens]